MLPWGSLFPCGPRKGVGAPGDKCAEPWDPDTSQLSLCQRQVCGRGQDTLWSVTYPALKSKCTLLIPSLFSVPKDWPLFPFVKVFLRKVKEKWKTYHCSCNNNNKKIHDRCSFSLFRNWESPDAWSERTVISLPPIQRWLKWQTREAQVALKRQQPKRVTLCNPSSN